MSSSLYRFGAQWRLTVRSHHRCLFLKFFFLSPPPLPKYKRTFNTRTNPAPLLLSGAGHVDVFNDVDGGGVDDYCSFVFGLLFYFNSFSFFIYIKDSLVQSSLEQREEKGRKKKAGKTSQSTRSLSKPQAEEVTSFNSFSRCVWCSGFVSAEKETTHRETHTHTHGQTQGSE